MADKDVDGLLRELAPAVDEIVCTASSSPRSLPADELADIANGIFASSHVHVAADVDTALAAARALAARPGSTSEAMVLVTGSVVTVADAERLLEAPATQDRPTVPPLPG